VARNKTDYQIRNILKYNRDGSPDRQAARHQNLMRCVRQLQERGYNPRWDVHKLGRKDVSRLVDTWRTQGLSHRTMANRLVDVRWLASKVGRADQIPTNREIGIGLRKNEPDYGASRAVELDPLQLDALDERDRLITELRAGFGLRTEEALKLDHALATRDPDHLELQGSWCKGGRPRTVQVRTAAQCDLLRRVGEYQVRQGDRSMIPAHRTFKSFYRDYNETRQEHGIPGHELRHQWAQELFYTVSGGIAAPHAGGPRYADLTEEERERWDRAARTVNRELGHGEGRADITATYIGKG